MNFNTTVNPDVHKFVVRTESGSAYGFIILSSAINFVEEIYSGVELDKLFNIIATAISEDRTKDLGIYDIESYMDLFEGE